MNLRITVPIATEPITLTEAKNHLRIVNTTEDTLITTLITVARETCENITNRALATQTLELSLDEFPTGNIRLPRPPLVSVTSIYYKDSDGTNTLWADTNYIVDITKEPGEVVLTYGNTYPSFTEYPTGAIVITYISGYDTTTSPSSSPSTSISSSPSSSPSASASSSPSSSSPSSNICPKSIKQAMLLLIGHLYEHREEVVSGFGGILKNIPMGIESLLQSYRIWT